VADERYRTQPQEAIRPRPGLNPREPNAARGADDRARPSQSVSNSRLSRRTLFGILAVGAAGIAAPFLLRSGSPELPEPAGQDVGPEYRKATLAFQPAPTIPMPPMKQRAATSTAVAAGPPGTTRTNDDNGWRSCVEGASAGTLSDLDLVLAVDTTASMGGVLNDVKANIRQLIANLQAGGGRIRVGVVAYRDRYDAYVVRSLPLTVLDNQGARDLDQFVAGLSAAGGADWPEKMDAALDSATSLAWRGDVPASIVVIADAPVHKEDENTATAIARAFAAKVPGGQISVVDTGSGAHAFMRALPRAGGGQYVTYDGNILNSLYPAITGCPGQ
jgi:Mg-chelatase subunit ChlD